MSHLLRKKVFFKHQKLFIYLHTLFQLEQPKNRVSFLSICHFLALLLFFHHPSSISISVLFLYNACVCDAQPWAPRTLVSEWVFCRTTQRVQRCSARGSLNLSVAFLGEDALPHFLPASAAHASRDAATSVQVHPALKKERERQHKAQQFLEFQQPSFLDR